MTKSLKNIVIIGGGAGGLELATNLGNRLKRRHKAIVTLVDCNHNHLWKPCLHQLASGTLDEATESISYMAHAQNHNFQFKIGYMKDVNRKTKQVFLKEVLDEKGRILIPARHLDYDILVLAVGSLSNDFGTNGVKEHCVSLDSHHKAKQFRKEMLNLFLKFSTQPIDTKEINVAIVGGGATGVELSAELHNMVKQLRNYGFKTLRDQVLKVTLIEAGTHILPTLPLKVSSSVHKKLTTLGIKILINTTVMNVTSNGLYTKNGEYIQSDLMVWSAGIKVSNCMKNIAGLETNSINQCLVSSTLQTTRDSAIFAIGDCASCTLPTGRTVPPRAQAAHQMATCTYKNILSLLYKKPLKSYKYYDHGSIISLSRFGTIGSLSINRKLNPLIIKGYIAYFIYIFISRMHQIALHGYIKTAIIVLVDKINRIVRPRIKFQ
ncbi:NADH dehydrogenase, FAD-containing subunit [secondary endosymbiont of Heteropsylla cubana]|uniref:NADH dehydrogenase, FAD-containing subunit n=1 Tax=secondary endosymbiont of Heteropsylla cubana TaxID=134287 RepID=J3TYS3_9ENTR|nr:NAD(P)/FAD-dependent oxidoreductase [secondary endosymbiont of Heteropsylla cubana]AFP85570.1 NADH dehydrogenase, FAD-containing subunit [secondary endosymbiont of Heteropsylla cubana]